MDDNHNKVNMKTTNMDDNHNKVNMKTTNMDDNHNKVNMKTIDRLKHLTLYNSYHWMQQARLTCVIVVAIITVYQSQCPLSLVLIIAIPRLLLENI